MKNAIALIVFTLQIFSSAANSSETDIAVCNAYNNVEDRNKCCIELGVPTNDCGFDRRSKQMVDTQGTQINVSAFDGQAVSRNPKDWHYEMIAPREIKIMGNYKFVQTEYIFQNTTKTFCTADCPYAYPAWDGTIDPVNDALAFLGLPKISKLVHTKDWQYTDPNYPQGEIIIFRGKYFDHLWKVIMRYR